MRLKPGESCATGGYVREHDFALCLALSFLLMGSSTAFAAGSATYTIPTADGYDSPFQKRPKDAQPIIAPPIAPDRSQSPLPAAARSDAQNRNANLPLTVPATTPEREQIIHVLNRITFGPSPGDIDAVKKMGLDAYIDQQLHPENIPESQAIVDFCASSDALTKTPDALLVEYGNPAIVVAQLQQNLSPDSDEGKMLRNKLSGDFRRTVAQDVYKGKLMRAIESPRQLQEVMVEFWFNHFNVYREKGNIAYTLGAYERQAIRPYALGNFRDLVGATCHHAAMMDYLDNSSNSAPRMVQGKPVGPGLNENYARELMELHTLGVDGGYTQKDVIELARILTGLTNSGHDNRTGALKTETCDAGTFFNARRHDFGDKVLLGQTIKGTGADEIDEALDLLCKNPATARHISYQLAQYFVSDSPPPALVKKLTARFLSSNGDIKLVMSDLLHSKEFMDTSTYNVKFKTPLRYLVSTVRSSRAKVVDYNRLQQFLLSQGEPLYGCLTPDGYKNVKDAWLNPDALMHRANFAVEIASGKFNGIDSSAMDLRNIENTLGLRLGPATLSAVNQAPPLTKAAVLLGSPEFMLY